MECKGQSSSPHLFSINKFVDDRGIFYESFSKEISQNLQQTFVQDNVSISKKGVVRGLHYQWANPMGKLVHVIQGKIVDFAVDIRCHSPTFGEVFSFEMSGENPQALWVPPGYAHGFEALEDTIMAYKCTAFYNKYGEGAINILDEDLKVPLTLQGTEMILSERDRAAQMLSCYNTNPRFYFMRGE